MGRIGFSRVATIAMITLLWAGDQEVNSQVWKHLAPEVVRAAACVDVKNNEPFNSFKDLRVDQCPGREQICRFIEFENVGGSHTVILKAYLNGRFHGQKKESFNDTTPHNGYRVWFCDKRECGDWREVIFLDNKQMRKDIHYRIMLSID